jgi:hypothetical protein
MDKTDDVNVTMQAGDWDIVIALVRGKTESILNDILRQAREQAAAQVKEQVKDQPPATNGVGRRLRSAVGPEAVPSGA